MATLSSLEAVMQSMLKHELAHLRAQIQVDIQEELKRFMSKAECPNGEKLTAREQETAKIRGECQKLRSQCEKQRGSLGCFEGLVATVRSLKLSSLQVDKPTVLEKKNIPQDESSLDESSEADEVRMMEVRRVGSGSPWIPDEGTLEPIPAATTTALYTPIPTTLVPTVSLGSTSTTEALQPEAAGPHAAALARGLGDSDEVVRTLVGSEGVAALAELMQVDEDEVPARAALVLGRMGDVAAPYASALVDRLNLNPEVRRCAAEALGAIGPSVAEHAMMLVRNLEDENLTVRQSVGEALGHLGDASAAALADRSGSPHALVRLAAAEASRLSGHLRETPGGTSNANNSTICSIDGLGGNMSHSLSRAGARDHVGGAIVSDHQETAHVNEENEGDQSQRGVAVNGTAVVSGTQDRLFTLERSPQGEQLLVLQCQQRSSLPNHMWKGRMAWSITALQEKDYRVIPSIMRWAGASRSPGDAGDAMR